MTDITPDTVARRVDALRRAGGRFDILDCETALQVADLAEALSARLAEVEAAHEGTAEKLNGYIRCATDALTRAEAAEAENAKLREALTPSGDTKAAYSGEFQISVYDCEDNQGNEVWRQVLVDWTTIKAIMSAIRARAALQGATK
jgi:hypothetical protein